jgi:hypothetical protein
MFPRQVFGLTGSDLLARLPRRISHPVSCWRSYLLTAAGQFRIYTGFPFHPPSPEKPSECSLL